MTLRACPTIIARDRGAEHALRLLNRQPHRLADAALGLPAAREGAVAVEMALLAPTFIFLCMAISDFGLALQVRTAVGNAARAGADYVSVNNYSKPGMLNAANNATGFATSSVVTTATGCPTAAGITSSATGNCGDGTTSGKYALIVTTGTYVPLMPALWPSGRMTFTATAMIRY